MEAELKTAAKAHFKNDAEYREFIQGGEIGWVKNNIYVPRIPTRAFLEAFPQHGGRYHSELVQSTANKIAKEMAVKEYGPGATVEQIANNHLISTVPEMYAMLRSLSEMSSEDAKLYLENTSEITELLAKARGEQ